MDVAIKMNVRIKGCTTIFADDLPPGVIATQVVTYHNVKPNYPMLKFDINERANKFVETCVVVDLEKL